MNKVSKVAGYKINIKNQLHFYLQTASMWKSKLKNTMPCIIASWKIGYLGINPTKQV